MSSTVTTGHQLARDGLESELVLAVEPLPRPKVSKEGTSGVFEDAPGGVGLEDWLEET
jgi:hypothetical protein